MLRLEIDRVERFAERLMTKPRFLVSLAQLMPGLLRVRALLEDEWYTGGSDSKSWTTEWPVSNHLFLLAGPDKVLGALASAPLPLSIRKHTLLQGAVRVL